MLKQTLSGLIAAVLLLFPPALLAGQQESVITGRVVSVQGPPVAGATVQLVGTARRTVTGSDGTYRLTVPAGTHRIRAESLGFRNVTEQVTVAASQSRTLNFALPTMQVELEEIVVSVTAGDTRRKEVGVDIAAIDVDEQIENAAVTDVSSLLNGRVGNVTVTPGSGDVGAGSRIRIRGINSLTQDNNPLLIVDGVRANNNTAVGITRGQTFSRFNDINPDDVESIQVVKGPAATALYGSEAAAGVIVIQTKKGRAGQTSFTLSAEQGWMEDVFDYPDNYADVTPFGITSPSDPRISQFRTEQNPVTGQVFVLDNPFEDVDTSPFDTGRLASYDLSVTGGSDDFNYYTSLRREDRTGVLPSNDLEQTSFRGNFRAMPREDVSVTVSTGYLHSETRLPKGGNNTSGFFANALSGIPFSSLGTNGDCLGTVLGFTGPGFCVKNGNTRAAFDKIAAVESSEDVDRFTASLQVDATPTSWLTVAATLGADVTDQLFTDAIPFDPDVPFSFAAGGENFLTRPLTRILTGDLSATARYRLNEAVGLQTSAGAQYFNTRIETISCEGRVFPNDQATACDAAVSIRGFSDLLENVEVGAYVQEQLAFNDYFFLTGSLRVDDNSALGEDEDVILSPSANTSLVLSDMPWWRYDAVSDLRLRAGWGTASQSPRQYAADRTFVITRLAREGNVVAGLSPLDPGNPDLGPERNQEIELGFNAGFLDNRVGVDFTYFSRDTEDAILSRPVAPSTGFASNRFINIGRLENSGIETSINALLLERQNFNWEARFQFSTVHPEVADLGIDNPIFVGVSQVIQTGFAPGAYVSRVIVDAERDANGIIIPESIVYAEGNLGDGSDLRVVGQPTPTNEQSFSTTMTFFRRLRFSTLIDRKAGHQLFNGLLAARSPGSLSRTGSRFGEEFAFRQIRSTPVEQAMMEQNELLGRHGAVFVEDADFIKWRELRLSYALPEGLLRRLGTSAADIYFGGRNLYTWTEFSGLDPESLDYGARDEIRNNVNNALPPARLFFSGIKVSF